MNAQVLLVDPDQRRAAAIARGLGAPYECKVAASVAAALAVLPGTAWYAVVVAFDLDPSFSGIEMLQEARERDERVLRVLYSSPWSPALVRESRRNAHAHAVLDADAKQFLASLRDTLNENRFDERGSQTAGAADESGTPLARWCAVAPATRRFLDDLRRAAESDSHVFVHGEPGSGKHLAAATLKHWRQHWRARAGERETTPPALVPAGVGQPRPSERAAIVVLEVPPLRDRRQDIPRLAEAFLREQAQEGGSSPRCLSAAAVLEMVHRDWRGNVQELRDALRRASQRAGKRPTIEASDLPRDRVPRANRITVGAKDSGQRKDVLRHLQVTGAVLPAAERARMPRPNFLRIMKRLGVLRADTARDDDA